VSSDHGSQAARDYATYTGFQIPAHAALIAFCGIDGSGKTTQLSLLAERLRSTHPVFTTRQPTTAFRTDPLVRSFIDGHLDGHDDAVAAEIGPEFALLAAADRYRHLRTVVMPRLRAGDIVLTDRYLFSCYSYCEPRRMAPLDWMQQINRYVPHPDLTVFLDVPAHVALERIRRRGERPTWEELDEHRVNEVRTAYQEQAWGTDTRYHRLDGGAPAEAVAERIATLADRMLRGKGLPGVAPAASDVTYDAASAGGARLREA
jgi:dTMP kinase